MSWKNPIDMFWTSTVEPGIFLLYFLVQLGQGMPWSAVSYMLNSELHLTYEQVNNYYAITYLPWSFKLVFGYISDSLPIFKHRRVPYFIAYSILVAILFCVYGIVVNSYTTALIYGTILGAAQCGAQLMIDTMVIERVHKETVDEGRGQALAMASKTAGTVCATILSLILLLPSVNLPYKWLFIFAGVPYLIAGVYSLTLNDRVVVKTSFMETIVEGIKLIFCGKRGIDVMARNKPIFPLLLFLVIRSALPTTSSTIYSFLYQNVSIEVWQGNVLNISTSLFSLAAAFVYNKYLVGKDLSTIILSTTIAACIGSMAQVYFVSGLIENQNVLYWVTILIMGINSFVSQLAWLPMMVMAAKACPDGYEASMWSIFFSLNDLAGSLGGYLSGKMCVYYNISYEDYSNLYKLVIVCSGLILLPLIYLFFIRDYFSIVATMADNTAEVRGGLSLLAGDEMEIQKQSKVYEKM